MNIVNWLNNVNERRKGKEREGERGKVWRGKVWRGRPGRGGGGRWMGRKVRRLLRGYVWARAAYPRYRYDQLMRLGWKVMRPVARGWVGRTGGRRRGRNGLV